MLLRISADEDCLQPAGTVADAEVSMKSSGIMSSRLFPAQFCPFHRAPLACIRFDEEIIAWDELTMVSSCKNDLRLRIEKDVLSAVRDRGSLEICGQHKILALASR